MITVLNLLFRKRRSGRHETIFRNINVERMVDFQELNSSFLHGFLLLLLMKGPS